MAKWFEKRRGTAISVAIAGNSVGQFVLVPLFGDLLLAEGWRTTMWVVGALSVVVDVMLALIVLRGDPEALGRAPYGHEDSGGGAAALTATPGASGPRSLTLREAMGTGSFWLFTVAMFVCGAGDFLLTTHLVPMATDHGVSTATSVSMLAWFGLLSLGGVLLAGPMSDAVGDKVPIAAAFALRVILFAVVVRYQNAASFWVLALGFGFTFLITAPLTTTLMGRMYGFASIGLLSGFITTVHHVGRRFLGLPGRRSLRRHRQLHRGDAGLRDRLRRGARLRALHQRGAARGAGGRGRRLPGWSRTGRSGTPCATDPRRCPPPSPERCPARGSSRHTACLAPALTCRFSIPACALTIEVQDTRRSAERPPPASWA